MQYEASTPAHYITELEDDWRKEKLLQLRNLILEKSPGLTESIQYKMLAYSDAQGPVFHLNAQKKGMSASMWGMPQK